jgi:hypothetical protein
VSDEIKPRIDEDGVGWCVQGCPFGDKEEATPLSDKTEEELCLVTKWECVCPVHARRMAQWAHDALSALQLCFGYHWVGNPLCEDEERLGELLDDYPGKRGAPCGTRRSEGGA